LLQRSLRSTSAKPLVQVSDSPVSHHRRLTPISRPTDRHAVGLIVLVALLANFLHLRSFGLYDDDWYYMAPAWDTTPQTCIRGTFRMMRSFYVGRPLQEACLRMFALAGSALHSVLVLYVIAGPAIGTQLHALQYSYRRLFGHGKAPEIFEVFGEDWKHYLQIGVDGAPHWTAGNFKGGWARDTKAPVGPIILLVERPSGAIERVDAPLIVDGKQVNRALPAAHPSDSNWNRFARSPLVKLVLPDLMP
jgi:hypothetical protein